MCSFDALVTFQSSFHLQGGYILLDTPQRTDVITDSLDAFEGKGWQLHTSTHLFKIIINYPTKEQINIFGSHRYHLLQFYMPSICYILKAY